MLKLFATVSFSLMLILSSATAIEYMGIDSKLGEATSVRIVVLSPGEKFELKTFFRVENLTSNAFCSAEANKISCDTSNITNLEIKFNSRELVKVKEDKEEFSIQLTLFSDVETVTSAVTLPKGSVVANVTDPFYPKKASLLTDGTHIIVYWEMANVSSDQPLSFSVVYTSPAPAKIPVASTVIVAVIAAVAVAVVFYKRMKRPEEIVLDVLDDYERKVFQIVKEADQVNQKKVVQATNFSKAKVSRVVKSLVERGLIESERRGRTNILRLRKKFLKMR